MRTFQEWTVLLIFGILDCVTGQLHAPLNITTESRNFSLFLTWLPAPGYPPDVTYIVKYKLLIVKRWYTVSKCNRTSVTKCDLTCVLGKNYTNLHALQVRAVSASQGESAWALLYNITYMFTVDPSPPILEIILGNGTMTINTSIETPRCMPLNLRFNLKFLLEIKNVNNPAEQIRQIEIIRPPKTINTDGYVGNYCMAAKTKYEMVKKTSRPSKFVCFNFTQKDESHQLMLLVGLPVILLAIFIVTLTCAIWNITNQRARTPEVLDFSHKKNALAISLIPEENPYPLTINNMDQASSAKHLFSGEEDSDGINEYPLSGCGYTERKTLQSNSLRRDTHDEESTSDEYMSSKSLPTNSSSDKSSDSSCVQTSGSNIAIQLHSNRVEINTNVSDNMEILVTNIITMGPQLDTLCVSDSNGFVGVHLNTLFITTATDQCLDNGSYDCNPTDFEDSHEQLTNDCTDSDTSESYVESQPLQKNSSSGYEQRGYISRRR